MSLCREGAVSDERAEWRACMRDEPLRTTSDRE
jgi:hypothetical protein